MEKLAYVLWKEPADGDDAFRDRLLAALPHALASAGAQRIAVSAFDSHVAAGAARRIARTDPPLQALVTFWLEASQDRAGAEASLAELAPRLAGYLVVESRPLAYDPEGAPPGARTPGWNSVACIEPRDGMSREAFVAHWYDVHRDVAVETQSTFSYVRNEVVRPLTPGAPPWAAVVEEGFPIEALTDPKAFYVAGDSDEVLKRNAARMIESCRAFLALDRLESHPMSEYRFAH